MGQSLVKNYIHITFSTKNREALIFEPYESELHAYIGGTCKELDCTPIIVGGYTDHIHILCMLSKKIALMTLVQKIKANSSKWIKTKDISLKNFYWQNGYGTFSVNPTQVSYVEDYIKNQHQHHKQKSYQEEYLSFLKKYEIPYNIDYLWD